MLLIGEKGEREKRKQKEGRGEGKKQMDSRVTMNKVTGKPTSSPPGTKFPRSEQVRK